MLVDEGVSRLTQWQRKLLADVELPAPDGRPLYAYRLSDAQFQSLEHVLKEQIQRINSLDYLSQTCDAFNALFVLYAAEWWRRRYNGSRWSWDPILADLGARNCVWSAIQRGNSVSQGLRYWKQNAGVGGSLCYLRSIAIQGGLPMQLLAEAKGKLGIMLRKVLKLTGGSAEHRQIKGWIESLGDDLPTKSYQRDEIYELLTDVIDTVLRLKYEAGLSSSSEAISQLDQKIPGWRNRFPLPVEDENIQGLIEQMIRDVSEHKPEQARSNIVVQRWLNNSEDDIWSLSSCVEMPDVLSERDVRKLFQIRDETLLPRNFELVLEAGARQQAYGTRKIPGHDAYRLERSPKELQGDEASAEHRIILRCADGQSWYTALRKGEALDDDLPWLFECSAEQLPKMIRQGGGDVATEAALVAIPAGTSIKPADTGHCEMVAFLETPEREIYSITGAVVVIDCRGRRSTLRTGRADASEESYQWHGDRVWVDFTRPNAAFRDKPRLSLLYGEEGMQKINEREVCWSHSSNIYGPIKAWYESKGELKYQSKLVLLPRDASIEYQPKNAMGGTIAFDHWNLASVGLVDETVADIQVHHDGASLTLTCLSKHTITPEWLELRLAWEGNAETAKVRLPFPAEGARAFDADGKDLCTDSWLSVQHLAGIRLVSFCRSHIPVELVFRLQHTKLRENDHELRRRIRPTAGTSRLDIRLLDYINEIHQLLAADELLDAWVEVGLHIKNKSVITVRVSRYTCRLTRMLSDVLITNEHLKDIDPEQLEALPVFALRLEHPAEGPVQLSCAKSQGVANGAWHFDPNSREPGAWLIFPGEGAFLAFRPTLWLVEGDSKANTPLANALAIENREHRALAMDDVIAEMAADFCHPSWQDLEHLAKHLGHLPLATLDVWRRFVHSPPGMAALALRMGNLPDGFMQRFPLEQPFVWEIVPMQAWLDTANQFEKQSVALFVQDLGQCEAKKYLKSRIEYITALNPSLGYLLGAVLTQNVSESKPGLDAWLKSQLFDRENGKLNLLRTSHRNEDWPKDYASLKPLIVRARNDRNLKHLFPDIEFGIKDEFVCANIPMLLATQVVTSDTDAWFSHPEDLFTLRSYMGFDPEWFANAFNLTIARCLATGVIKI